VAVLIHLNEAFAQAVNHGLGADAVFLQAGFGRTKLLQ
jgi:hypothetical protein